MLLFCRWIRLGVPSAPSDVIIRNITSISVLIKWSPGKSFSGQNSTDLTYYIKYSVHRLRNIDCKFCQITSPIRNTIYVLKGLDSFTVYDISVIASNKLGNKSSAWIRFTTLGNEKVFNINVFTDCFNILMLAYHA